MPRIFGHPSPVVGRQMDKTNTLALALGIPPRFLVPTQKLGLRGGETRGVPHGTM